MQVGLTCLRSALATLGFGAARRGPRHGLCNGKIDLMRPVLSLLAACGEGSALQLLDVQLAGGRPISAADFANGHQPKPGERLGEQA